MISLGVPLAAVMLGSLGSNGGAQPAGSRLDRLKLPAGFSISVFSDKVPGARSMTLSPAGTLFVGTQEGNVYALKDANKDGKADEVFTISKGLNSPNGVAFRGGSLYVAEISRVIRFDAIESSLQAPPKPVVVNDSFPDDRAHGWKFIAFGPDGLLYVPVGAPCNVCDRGDPYASMTRMKPDGSGFEVYARGIRNTVGFAWHPATKVLWFTDNGRDNLGDDVPDDELNQAPKKGMHFGYPYCHAGSVSDPQFGSGHACSQYTPPVAKLGAHVAALGMRFYTGRMFPAEYRNSIFIAEHGSWNRSTPVGYRVVRAQLDGDRVVKVEPFVEGWLQGSKAWGRPVDVEVMPDGSLLISDDENGAIYRVTAR